MSKILINAVDPEEIRIAKVRDSKLEEFNIASAAREITHGNIYKGVIARIEPSLQAAFIDFGAERHGFLQRHEIHPDYFQDTSPGHRSITQIIKRGQELLVQVTKDPVMQKGAMLTTYISLPGRNVVLMPGSTNKGISRKIENDEERQRLKAIVETLKIPEGFGLIVRTAGVGATKTTINKDLRYLLRVWRNIKKKGINDPALSLLYKDQNIAVRSIRDYFTTNVSEIMIDDAAVFNEIKGYFHIISPKQKKIVKLYRGAKPIFSKFQLEEQIASIFENRVNLRSGGTIVIQPTEALVSIDVNSGKGTHKKSVEETALMTNLEAAEEVARQLRLRDLGGLVVIDFIDMRDNKNRLQVERTMKANVKGDRAKTNLGRISKFGLMEMSRQRLRPSLESMNFEPCENCHGKGLIQSSETLALGFLRKLRLETLKIDSAAVRGILPLSVADYLLNQKRKELLDLELRRDMTIVIQGENALKPGESKIEFT